MTKERKDFAQGEQAAIPRDLSRQGGWVPLIDWSSIYPGNRGVGRDDRYDLYDAPVGIELKIEEGEKIGPVLSADQPWDGEGSLVPMYVWKDDKEYHLLYASHPRSRKNPGLGGHHYLCYATSSDGYEWRRPELGQVEWEGSTKNNIIADGPTGTPFIDPQGKLEERFKAIGQVGGSFDPDTGEALDTDEAYKRWVRQEYEGEAYTGPKSEFRHWVDGWVSPDGVHWKNVGKLGDMSSDGGTAAQYDPETQSYYAYIRVGGAGRRATGLTRTDDFWNWPHADLVLFPDPQDDPDVSFYACSYFRYPTDDSLHGAFVEIYHQIADYNDSQLAFSRDMTHWVRPERRAAVPIGPPGSRDSGGARPWGGLFELSDGAWATLYRGHQNLHNYRDSEPRMEIQPGVLMIARWLPHRFAGVEASSEGRFTIPTIKRSRNELRINYRCANGGYVTAELIRGVPSRIHPDADPIPGYSFADADLLTGGSLDSPLTWNGKSNLGGAGDTIAVRLKLFQAKVFAYST